MPTCLGNRQGKPTISKRNTSFFPLSKDSYILQLTWCANECADCAYENHIGCENMNKLELVVIINIYITYSFHEYNFFIFKAHCFEIENVFFVRANTTTVKFGTKISNLNFMEGKILAYKQRRNVLGIISYEIQ